MDTTKLYYEDCHMLQFTAQVKSCTQTERGWQITLDRTAFYPEGGGQACDLGVLDNVRVLDVREKDEQVIHLCEGPLEVGSTVTGTVDRARRFDLMQQHTGEHIVSGVIHAAYGWHNVGFHMGKDTVTIDFDGPIPQEALKDIELRANEAVWRDLPVRCYYPSEEELPQVNYRSKRALPWPVRIVEVPGYDCCACCGVHTARTGEVGLIKLLSCVKFHQGVRIEMVCGGRALELFDRIYEQNRQVSQTFSAKLLETGAAAKRMAEQLSAEKYRAAALEKQVFDYIAVSYAGKGNVLHFARELTPGSLRELAERIGAVCGGTAAVASGEEGCFSLCMISNTDDLKTLGQEVAKALCGRGGGKPGSFQGSINATAQQIKAFFLEKGFLTRPDEKEG